MIRCQLSAGVLALTILSAEMATAQEQGAPVVLSSDVVPAKPQLTPSPTAAEHSKNVRLEVIVTAGSGSSPRTLHQATLLLRSDAVSALNVSQQIRLGTNYQGTGLQLTRVVPRLDGTAVNLDLGLSFNIPQPDTEPSDSMPKELPPTIEQTLNVRLENGKRTTVLSTRAPGVDGPVAVQMTATVLNP